MFTVRGQADFFPVEATWDDGALVEPTTPHVRLDCQGAIEVGRMVQLYGFWNGPAGLDSPEQALATILDGFDEDGDWTVEGDHPTSQPEIVMERPRG